MRRSMTCWLGTAGLLLAVPFLTMGCHRPHVGTAQPARIRQEEAARLLGKPKQFINSIGMKMVLIPAGEFQMGSKLSAKELAAKYGGIEKFYAAERPIHTVSIAKPFYMGATEVTQAQWMALMGTNPSDCKGNESRPVGMVSWGYAQEFCKKLATKEKREYRLPTEAEWEYACRAGSTGEYCFGDDKTELGKYAWYEDNTEAIRVFGITISRGHRGPHPVAQKKPNAWGLYDMHGNAFEWCQDIWHENYEGAPTDSSAWSTGGNEELRVLRGGAFGLPRGVRCAYRYRYGAHFQSGNVGFRVVVSPLPPGSGQAKE